MKALTLWQPYASLVMANAKPWEFRARSYFAYIAPPNPGDRIAIHAASRPSRLTEVDEVLGRILSGDAPDLVADRARAILEPLRTALRQPRGSGACRARHVAPLGVALGTAIIGEPRKAYELFGTRPGYVEADYNWAWPLTEIEPFAVPIPARGMQGFWKWKP